jgi:GTPase involved in cell partitioning and DNA repair
VYQRLCAELGQYSETLAEKPHVVLLTKSDLLAQEAALPGLEAPGALGMRAVSSATGAGIEELKEWLWRLSEQVRAEEEGEDAFTESDELTGLDDLID